MVEGDPRPRNQILNRHFGSLPVASLTGNRSADFSQYQRRSVKCLLQFERTLQTFRGFGVVSVARDENGEPKRRVGHHQRSQRCSRIASTALTPSGQTALMRLEIFLSSRRNASTSARLRLEVLVPGAGPASSRSSATVTNCFNDCPRCAAVALARRNNSFGISRVVFMGHRAGLTG